MIQRISYDAIIQQILKYMRTNLSEPLSLDMICQVAGYSKTQLEQIFKRQTGKGIFAHLADLRLDKAKDLLRNTRLGISEVALAAGFRSHTYFTDTFRKRTGLSPKHFRNKTLGFERPGTTNASGEGSELWFRDSLAGGSYMEKWEPRQGEWKQEIGSLAGTCGELGTLALRRLLPENFQLDFEIQVKGIWGIQFANFVVVLRNKEGSFQCYQIKFGDNDNTQGVLQSSGGANLSSHEAVIREGAWHRIRIELNDDTLTVMQDSEVRFHFRDAFPPSYGNRCVLEFLGWQCTVNIRNCEIRDLGFLPYVRTVRSGDSLYNLGQYGQAGEFYSRLLTSNSPTSDVSELHFKIGTCCLRAQEYDLAREWLSKTSGLPGGDFWVQHAELALTEAAWRETQMASFQERVKHLFREPGNRDYLRQMVQNACADFQSRGFGEIALNLHACLVALETPGSLEQQKSLWNLSEVLINLNRYEIAAEHLRELIARSEKMPQRKSYLLFSYADALTFLRQHEEARKAIDDIRRIAKNPETRIRISIYEASRLHAAGDHQQAINQLLNLPVQFPNAPHMCAYASLIASWILAGLDVPDESGSAFARAEEIAPEHVYLRKGKRSEYQYPHVFLKGDFENAAEILLIDSQVEDGQLAVHAEQALKAGILYELAGDIPKATETWDGLVRRFPLDRCNYYGRIAEILSGKAPLLLRTFFDMPFRLYVRMEVFLLTGLLLLKRNDPGNGLTLLRQCAEEDSVNFWAGMIAKKRLNGGFHIHA